MKTRGITGLSGIAPGLFPDSSLRIQFLVPPAVFLGCHIGDLLEGFGKMGKIIEAKPGSDQPNGKVRVGQQLPCHAHLFFQHIFLESPAGIERNG